MADKPPSYEEVIHASVLPPTIITCNLTPGVYNSQNTEVDIEQPGYSDPHRATIHSPFHSNTMIGHTVSLGYDNHSVSPVCSGQELVYINHHASVHSHIHPNTIIVNTVRSGCHHSNGSLQTIADVVEPVEHRSENSCGTNVCVLISVFILLAIVIVMTINYHKK